MSEQNKVRFGLSQVHVGTYTDTNGTVTLGNPMAIPGAVSLNLDPDVAESVFYADNMKYFVRHQANGYKGDLVMAKFPDAFKTAFMNYVAMTGGGTGETKKKSNVPIYLAFQIEGDVKARKVIMYNVELGAIKEEHGTTEEEIEPQTESLNINVIGDNTTGLVKVTYDEGDTNYATLFSAPPVPALPASM